MNAEREVEKAVAFLEATRTAIDSAELAFIGSLTSDRPSEQLRKGSAQLGVGARNIQWAADCIVGIAEKLLAELNNAAAVDGSAAGNTLATEQKTGGNRVP